MTDRRNGFTLIELLMYTAVFAVVAGISTSILITVLKVQNRESAGAEAVQQTDFVMTTLQRLIRQSSLVEISPGVATTTLKLRMRSLTEDPTYVTSDANGVYLTQGAGASTTLTTSRVTVGELTFKKYENAGGHDTVEINLTLNSVSPTAVSRTLRSAIARVSAATFDSSVVPGGSGYDVGLVGSRWRSGFFSSDLTSPVLYGSAAASGNLTIDSTSNSTKGNVILNPSGGSVGVGTASPSTNGKLHVAGGDIFLDNGQKVKIGTNFTNGAGFYFDTSLGWGFRGFSSGSNYFSDVLFDSTGGSGNNSRGIRLVDANGSAVRLFVGDTGNVGIGTSTPATARLVVASSSGVSVDATSGRIINLASPTASADAATKGYVDAQVGGGFWLFGTLCKNVSASCLPAVAWGSGGDEGQSGSLIWPVMNVYQSDESIKGSEGDVKLSVSKALTFKNLGVNLQIAPGNNTCDTPLDHSRNFILRKNGANTALSCTITGSAKNCSDLSNQVSFVAGDFISFRASTTLAVNNCVLGSYTGIAASNRFSFTLMGE